MSLSLHEQVNEAVEFLSSKAVVQPRVGIVLGSGLSGFADRLSNASTVHYADIPHFPQSSVAGHRGELVVGTLNNSALAVMSGRVHYYEGYDPSQVAFPIRVLAKLGIDTLIVTNASGSTNPAYEPGEVMVINDHINFTGNNPLMGPNESEFGPRFPDMSKPYDPELSRLLIDQASALDLVAHEGVYIGVSGPSYETPAEIAMFHKWGADAVGMSTVYEVIAAKHMNLRVGGISVITNKGSGLSATPLSHEEVKERGAMVRDKLCDTLEAVLQNMPSRTE